MTARLVVPGTAPREQWLAERRARITASEIAVVMGLSPWSSPYALYQQKLGVLPEQDETDAMALGKHMESWVAAKFAEQRPEFEIGGDGQALWAHGERDWQAASPDRLLYEGPGIDDDGSAIWPELLAVLECKIDGGPGEWGEDGSDQIPVHYRCQVLWQMDVMGVQTGYVACLLWNKRQVRVCELTMDAAAEADLKLMREEGWAFLERLYKRDEPPIDWRPATSEALKRLHPSVEDRDVQIPRKLAAQYRAACAAVKTAQQRKQLAENQIRQRMGTARRAVENAAIGRFAVARRDVYELPEKTIVRKAATVDRLVPVKPPAPKENP